MNECGTWSVFVDNFNVGMVGKEGMLVGFSLLGW